MLLQFDKFYTLDISIGWNDDILRTFRLPSEVKQIAGLGTAAILHLLSQ